MAESTRGTAFITRSIAPRATELLRDAGVAVRRWEVDTAVPREHLLAEAAEVEALLTMATERIDEELLTAAAHLKVVANFAVGYDNIDVAACTRHGVVATNTPGVLHETTADLTWALLLAAARRIPEGAEYVKAGRWQTWSPSLLLGADVHHKTLGIVGMGAIGWEVAKRAFGFDMRVLYHSRTRRTDLEEQRSIEFVDLDTLLGESDFVSIHAPLSPATRHLIGMPELRKMKRSAFLVNTSRGPLVDQAALYDALHHRLIAGAALDVTDPEPMAADDPLLSLPNALVVPHIGSASAETRTKMGVLAAENIAAVLNGRRPPTPLNPEVLDRVGAT